MQYGEVLKRAWHTVWRYKALWIFGAILAFTAGASSGAPYYRASGEDFQWELGPTYDVPQRYVPALIGIAIALAVEVLVLVIIAAIARYVAETSLIGMVDLYEEKGEMRRVRQGFRMGWSRTAWRLFLIDLVVGLPVKLAILLLFALVGAPALLWLTRSNVAGAIGTAVTVLLFIPAVLVAIVVGVGLDVLMRFFRRACVTEGLGVTASIRRGYSVARRDWSNVVVVWLIMRGIGIGWAIASLILCVVLLPLFILLVLLGIVAGGFAGGLPALVAYGVASLASTAPGSWVPYIAAGGVGIAIGLPLFILIAGVPWSFVNGLMAVFGSSVWTQTYRELRARHDAVAAPLPEPEPSGVEELEAIDEDR